MAESRVISAVLPGEKKKLNRKKRIPTEYPNAFGEPLKGGMIIIIFVLCFLVAIDHVY